MHPCNPPLLGDLFHIMLSVLLLLYSKHSVVVSKYSAVEMQRYTIWTYQYIATCVSRYSDILHDIVKCKFINF